MPIDAPRAALLESLRAGRVHSAYLFSGAGPEPREAAHWFVRALACRGDAASERPCEQCGACRRSAAGEAPKLDGKGKAGPLYRHVGEHPDLVWVERGADDTRVTIGQIRALQEAFRLRAMEGGRRAGVVADAEWLNQEAQNALLRLLEEPPRETSFVLVTRHPAGLLATVRSRCQRVAFAAGPEAQDASDDERALAERIADLGRLSVPELLDWAEEFRGPRAIAAAQLTELLAAGAAYLHESVGRSVARGADVAPRLGAWATLQQCRKSLAQRNANPQMVAERALLALREALA